MRANIAMGRAFRMVDPTWDAIGRMAFPFAAPVAKAAWLAVAAAWTGGHWVPLPWDVTGDWSPPAEWPPLTRVGPSVW